MECPRCHQHNPEDAVLCRNCMLILSPPNLLLPIVNHSIGLAQGIVAGAVTGEQLSKELAGMRAHLESYKAKSAEVPIDPDASDLVKHCFELMEKAYAGFSAGWDQMEQYAKDGSAAHLAEGVEALVAASVPLFEVDLFAEMAKKSIPAPIPCVKCGNFNPGGSKRCDRCGATLLQQPGGAEPDAAITVTEGSQLPSDPSQYQSSHFLRLQAVAKGVLAGDHPPEELGEAIRWMRTLVTQGEEEFTRLQQNRAKPAATDKEYYALMQSALTTYRAGLDRLAHYLTGKAPDDIHDGLAQCQEASEELVRVFFHSQDQRQHPAGSPPPAGDSSILSDTVE